jgi:hypothetical protein
MAQLIDALEFKPDNFLVAPKEEWRIMSLGPAKRPGTQPRYCAANCEFYLKDKDGKCGIFFECDHFVFDMHRIEMGDAMVFVLFATETTPPYDGLGWWVSERQLVEVMGTLPNGKVDMERGGKIVDAMIDEYMALVRPPKDGFVIS